MYQLPGPMPVTPVTAARSRHLLPFILLWFALIAGFALYRISQQRTSPAPPVVKTPIAARDVGPDAARHVAEALDMTTRLQADLRASRRTLLRAVAEEDHGRNRLTTELQSALGLTMACQHESDRLQAELEFIRATLQGEKP